MSSEALSFTVEDLVRTKVLAPPIDGNHGGIHPKVSDYVPAGVPFIMASDLKNGLVDFGGCAFISEAQAKSLRKGFAKPGDILISHKATIGRTALLTDEFPSVVLTPQVTYYRVLDEGRINNRYLKYYFDSKEFQQLIGTWAGAGSTRAYIGITAQAKLPIVLPPIGVQKAIAEFLGAIDDRITLLRASNTTLEAIAQALFKSWFVDFDPVHAKQQGRVPEGMDAQTAALFPDSLEESELGMVPKGWSPVRLDSFVELAYGKALKAEARIAGDVPVYGSGGITGWHNAALVNQPSIVVGRKGTVGSLYWENRPFFPIDTVFYVKTEKPLPYVFQVLKSLGLSDMNTDAAVPGLNRENAYRLLVAGASEEVIKAFDSIASDLRMSVVHNLRQIETLESTRDTLLPRLISGQLRLPEVQALVEDAVDS